MKKGNVPIGLILLCSIILYIGWIYSPTSTIPTPITISSGTNTVTHTTITVLIGGDIMLDREERLRGEKKGYDSLFSGITELFHSADLVVANLEGPITTNESKTFLADGKLTKSFSFTFATSTALVLKRAGIDLVSLANNHSENFGRSGIEETREWLTQAGVSWFGDPDNSSSTEKILCKNEICVAFVGYHEFSPGLSTILADVQRLSAQGYPVIVMPHWGDEYALVAPERIREEALKFVQAGATAIIGSHPHVRENREWLGDVPVIYSLGNLVFDQYFSKEVLTGNIAELTISKDGILTHIDKVRLYTVSNASRNGPVIVGEPVEF